jgi:hypothetical protein
MQDFELLQNQGLVIQEEVSRDDFPLITESMNTSLAGSSPIMKRD